MAAVVVVHAVGQVAILLDLGNQNSLTDGVRKSCGDEVGLACLHPLRAERGHQFAARKRRLVGGVVVALGKTANDLGILVGVYDVPHLGFSAVILHTCGVIVVGVDLDREAIGGVDELDQEREFTVT